MTEAGIRPHDPVLLVGHSLGGMEAASMLAHGSGFDVTHVVTAGSPLGAVHGYPAGTHVLSLENRGDLVPLLDGRDNADTTQQVTVQFDDHETSMIGNHGLQHYLRGAAAADGVSRPVGPRAARQPAHGRLPGIGRPHHREGLPDQPVRVGARSSTAPPTSATRPLATALVGSGGCRIRAIARLRQSPAPIRCHNSAIALLRHPRPGRGEVSRSGYRQAVRLR